MKKVYQENDSRVIGGLEDEEGIVWIKEDSEIYLSFSAYEMVYKCFQETLKKSKGNPKKIIVQFSGNEDMDIKKGFRSVTLTSDFIRIPFIKTVWIEKNNLKSGWILDDKVKIVYSTKDLGLYENSFKDEDEY